MTVCLNDGLILINKLPFPNGFQTHRLSSGLQMCSACPIRNAHALESLDIPPVHCICPNIAANRSQGFPEGHVFPTSEASQQLFLRPRPGSEIFQEIHGGGWVRPGAHIFPSQQSFFPRLRPDPQEIRNDGLGCILYHHFSYH